MKKKFYVVYRTGNSEKCIWERTEPMGKIEARAKVNFFEDGNVKAFIVDKKMSDIIGLPEGWEYKIAQKERK